MKAEDVVKLIKERQEDKLEKAVDATAPTLTNIMRSTVAYRDQTGATRQSTLAFTMNTSSRSKAALSIARSKRPLQTSSSRYIPHNDVWGLLTVYTTYAPDLLIMRSNVWRTYARIAQDTLMRQVRSKLK